MRSWILVVVGLATLFVANRSSAQSVRSCSTEIPIADKATPYRGRADDTLNWMYLDPQQSDPVTNPAGNSGVSPQAQWCQMLYGQKTLIRQLIVRQSTGNDTYASNSTNCDYTSNAFVPVFNDCDTNGIQLAPGHGPGDMCVFSSISAALHVADALRQGTYSTAVTTPFHVAIFVLDGSFNQDQFAGNGSGTVDWLGPSNGRYIELEGRPASGSSILVTGAVTFATDYTLMKPARFERFILRNMTFAEPNAGAVPGTYVHASFVSNFIMDHNYVGHYALTEGDGLVKFDQSSGVILQNNVLWTGGKNLVEFVSVQCGMISHNYISESDGSYCVYAKAGSAHVDVVANVIDGCTSGGVSAGEGSNSQALNRYRWPGASTDDYYVQYEAYDVRIFNNVIRNTGAEGIALQGAYNTLVVHNTMMFVGTSSASPFNVTHSAARFCNSDGGGRPDLGLSTGQATCDYFNGLGGWSPSWAYRALEGSGNVWVPNRGNRIFNNLVYLNPGVMGGVDHAFEVSPARAGDNWMDLANLHWNILTNHHDPAHSSYPDAFPDLTLADEDLRIGGNAFSSASITAVFNPDPMTPRGCQAGSTCSEAHDAFFVSPGNLDSSDVDSFGVRYSTSSRLVASLGSIIVDFDPVTYPVPLLANGSSGVDETRFTASAHPCTSGSGLEYTRGITYRDCTIPQPPGAY